MDPGIVVREECLTYKKECSFHLQLWSGRFCVKNTGGSLVVEEKGIKEEEKKYQKGKAPGVL